MRSTQTLHGFIASLTLAALSAACSNSSFSGSGGKAQPPKTTQRSPAKETKETGEITIPVDTTTNIDELPQGKQGKIKSITSADPTIAVVDANGNITGVSPGTTTIKVVYDNGTAVTITVTVTDSDSIIDTGIPKSIESLGDNAGMEQAFIDDTGDGPLLVFRAPNQGGIVTRPLSPDAVTTVYAATQSGNAHWFRLEGDAVAETKKWTGLLSTEGPKGSRTYVTEKGVVIARKGGHLYWIDPAATPEGAINHTAPNYHKLPNVGNDDRVCIVSYRRDKKRYVGMGWGAGKFVEFPMENTPPYAPIWATPSDVVTVPNLASWGYSCYIDQARLIYYGQWVNGTTGVGAIDLKTMTAIDPGITAPNAKFVSTDLPNVSLGVQKNGSYVINGDLAGNVFNGENMYTLAHNRVLRTVWGLSTVDNSLKIYPDKCLISEAKCSGHASFLMAEFGGRMPLSALPDGRMIAMKRSDPPKVYLLKVKDRKDISKGIDATPIADVDGDPYMYTDFTGATLYLTKSDTTFELDATTGYDASKTNKAAGFTWLSRSTTDVAWVNLKFEIRCYMSTAAKGDFETVETIKDALKQTLILTNSCKNQSYDRIDVRITQLQDDDTLMNISRIQMTAYQ